jgi:hypothetical protein
MVLVQVKNKRERSLTVRPPGVEKTSRLHSRDAVASGVKCGPHGGMNSKMKSWTVSWLSHKTKVESGLRGRRVMSGDWRRLHRVCGVSSGSPENHWVPWLIHKARTEKLKTEMQQLQTGLTGGSDRSVLTDKRRIHLRSASVRTYTIFTTGFPRFLSIRGARGLQAFDLPLLTNYSNPN